MAFWFPKEKEFRMVWKIERSGIKNLFAGSAHFFPYSFRRSLVEIISGTSVVLFEGPLDETNMSKVRQEGVEEKETGKISNLLDKDTLAAISREFARAAPADSSLKLFADMLNKGKGTLIPEEIDMMKPWMAFFSIWSHYLKKRGWTYSVDLEALSVAKELGKDVRYLETIEEQIEALNGIPVERIVNFFRRMNEWDTFAKNHAQRYLKGSIESVASILSDFPSRCESIVEKRDPVMFERMMPFIEQGNAIVFVGTTHIPGIKRMFEEKGYTATRLER
jgi:pheromone shutdown protein TraB